MKGDGRKAEVTSRPASGIQRMVSPKGRRQDAISVADPRGRDVKAVNRACTPGAVSGKLWGGSR